MTGLNVDLLRTQRYAFDTFSHNVIFAALAPSLCFRVKVMPMLKNSLRHHHEMETPQVDTYSVHDIAGERIPEG